MRNVSEYEQDLASIRNVMERSTKFLSLSGVSGILAGVYALTGIVVVHFVLHYPLLLMQHQNESSPEWNRIIPMAIIAVTVLIASLLTGFIFSQKKAAKTGIKLWNKTSQRLLVNLSIPLFAGGCFILILLFDGYYGLIAPACLLFYGLALINASANLYDEIRYLGFSEIVLGLLAAMLPSYGLVIWSLGFGLLHIIYGSVMYYRYDQ